MKRRDLAYMLLAGLSSVAAPAVHAADAGAHSWNFQVLLNDSVIGSHRFSVTAGEDRELTSVASFKVKVIGITAFHYDHKAVENWHGDCLMKITAKTNDDGKESSVEGASDGKQMPVTSTQGKKTLDGCVMSFAYWNPVMLKHNHLLNAQTGEYEAVTITTVGDEKIMLGGKSIAAKHYHLAGPKNPLELWYSADGEWLALESMINGRRLRYQLETAGA